MGPSFLVRRKLGGIFMATASVSTQLPVVVSYQRLSLQSAKYQAIQITDLLKKKFDIDRAALIAKELYREGVEITAFEVKGNGSKRDYFTPVMLEIEKSVSNPDLQHHFKMHNVLSRVYRLFTDLTWYKCWTTKIPADRQTRTQTLQVCRDRLAILPESAIKARFEYECAIEGATILEDSKGTWGKYFEVMVKAAGSAFVLSFGEVLGELGKLRKHIRDDWSASWFVDVWRVRWQSSQIQTVEDFNKTLGKELSSLKDVDPKLSLCIAMLLKDLLRSPNLPPEVKGLAFGGLVQLLHLKHGIVSNFANHVPLDAAKKAATKLDPYEITRRLVIQYLGTLIRKEFYMPYREGSLRALMELNIDTRYENEKRQIREIISQNTKRKDEVVSRRDDLEEDIGNMRLAAQSKGSADDAKLAKAEEEYNTLNKNVEDMEVNIDYSKKALAHLEATEKEEKDLIQKIIKQAEASKKETAKS